MEVATTSRLVTAVLEQEEEIVTCTQPDPGPLAVAITEALEVVFKVILELLLHIYVPPVNDATENVELAELHT